MPIKSMNSKPKPHELEVIENRIAVIRDIVAPLQQRDRLLVLNAVLRTELDRYQAAAARHGVARGCPIERALRRSETA